MNEESIFAEAVGKPPAERAVYLDAACGLDAALRGRVEALISAHENPDPFFAGPCPEVASTVDLPHPAERLGTVVGPYKLVNAIGEGGMGAVYLAQQLEPVRRLVALKVVKAGMDTKQVLARFEAERQALALMDHPNIAKVLDAGATEAGGPYFVMELVKGVPITQFCDERRLTPRARLELFVPVCQAVQHAHQKGVIHRDLKPTNVLVALYDGKPVPKVIDFGVAKAAGQPLTEKTLVTGLGAVVGTPEYMSPEQAELNQLDIDTRSDVYSLGVLLYELLTGTTPLQKKRVKEAAFLEVLRLVREEEPPRPSTRLSTTDELPSIAANRGLEPKKLSGLVRGELDWIVMKCLEKDRGRRYESANGLAMDLQRYLGDEALEAGPPSVRYRARKFARRHRGGLAVAGLVLVFLVLLGGAFGWAFGDRAARQTALEHEAARALDDVAEEYRRGHLAEASADVQRAAGLLASGGRNPVLQRRVDQWQADLELVRRLDLIRLDRSMVRNGRFDRAAPAPAYWKAFREYGLDVEALDPEAIAERVRSSPVRDRLVAALDDWALSETAAGRPAAAALRGAVSRADGDPLRDRLRAAVQAKDRAALAELARDEQIESQPPDTVLFLAQALSSDDAAAAVAVLRRAQKRHPDDFWINHDLGYGLLFLKPTPISEAAGFLRAAVALRPQSPGARANLGYALSELGKWTEAEVEFREAIRLLPNYAVAYYHLGLALRRQGRPDEAIAEYRSAIALDPKYFEAVYAFGNVLRQQGRLAEAAAEYRRAIALAPKEARPHANLGLTLDGLQPAEAEAEFRAAIALDPDLAEAHYNLANNLRRQGRLADAEVEDRRSVALMPKDAEAHTNLGYTLRLRGKWAEAEAELRTAVALNPELAPAHNALAWVLAAGPDPKRRDPGRAVEEAKRAVALTPKVGTYWNTLGVAHYRAGDWQSAADALEKATALRAGGDGTDWFFLAMAHAKLGHREDARQWYDRAVGWTAKNRPNDEDLRRFRAEAAEVLRLKVD